jgi:hypothetical protein
VTRRLTALAFLVCLLAACGGDDDGPAQAFPDDYASSYVEVRDCRKSGDHDLNYIRVLADPAALAPYRDRNAAFPEGAVVLKEEHDFADDTCTGEVRQWTVMVKRAAAADQLGWDWQRVDQDHNVVEENAPRCIGCHQGCGGPPDGYDGTCAVP